MSIPFDTPNKVHLPCSPLVGRISCYFFQRDKDKSLVILPIHKEATGL